MTKEIKGVVTIDDIFSLTCCEERPKIMIGETRLDVWIGEVFDLDRLDDDNSELPDSPLYRIRYTTTAADDDPDLSFEQRAAEVQGAILFGDYVHGCYSEWTCGWGEWDYVVQDGGHSIFRELKSANGKFLHLAIDIDPIKVAS